jgi:tRNA modification GTPase
MMRADEHTERDWDQDTIVAISTPPGRGGIGVVRLSGPAARSIAGGCLRCGAALTPSRARFTQILDETGAVLDEAVVTYFQAPHSYTTEDVVEIAAHGAPVILEYLVRGALSRGARLAQPGEFTQRAFLAGRLDLTQAEAVNDLISAQTLHQAKTAAAQLGGAIAQAVRPLKESLLTLIAGLEAGVDFAEDDLDLLPDREIVERLAGLEAELAALAKSYAYGRMVREGLTLAIVGAPNAGKSSLFNRLLERERAIVTALPGTTRDTLTEQLALDGIPINLVDTAGLREVALTPETEAERAGIERSRRTLADADLVLHVVDSAELAGAGGASGLRREDELLRDEVGGRPYLLVLNKGDLAGGVADGFAAMPGLSGAVVTSALTGAGLDELRDAVRVMLAARPAGDSAVVTNLRQSQTIGVALGAVRKAKASAKSGVPHEFLLLDLHEALSSLGELTGATTTSDLLALIFGRFCVGK